MEAELRRSREIVEHPVKPFVCAIGGAKVKDKIGVLERLCQLVDAFCIGGGMANTFLAAQGIDVGKSLRDDDLAPAQRILALAKRTQRHRAAADRRRRRALVRRAGARARRCDRKASATR